ncbi:SDR family oxidoreductase [Clostridium sp. AM58-1XD]|uniref:SDR family NAD(P)-dependent oxidoreductase n=1 Tax=Clostridium sp. AM58-1XD TaxID=2292307 RepID=UPI000E4E7390|nr:SDR family oxidoreductase [Clostridium sp. AM58-1XD]RGY94784.1 SDR family NAD(P)-dependent oxidoreductase [Clostridium sp. AM58-1XD]
MARFSGKTFLIAGASSGIGKNVAEYLTKETGANVVLVARRKEILSNLAEILPGNNYAIAYDFSDLANIGEIFDDCLKNNISLDGVVYSAGIAPLYWMRDNDNKKAIETITVNALAFGEMGKYMLNSKCMKKNASVVVISSIVSLVVTNRQSAYAASKSVLNTYVKYLAKEALGKMRVNAILPGVVETELYQELRSQSKNLEEKTNRNQPLGIIPPQKISKMVEYLLSEDSDFVTGSLFIIDGGFLLK